jgi:hypothetical protein
LIDCLEFSPILNNFSVLWWRWVFISGSCIVQCI